MKKIKVAYFGTSDRSTPILEKLDENFELVLCVTKGNTRIGRNQEIHETAVKKWAVKHEKKLVEIGSLHGDDLNFVLTALNKAKPDFGIVADFSFIIPEDLIKFFNKKLINIHFSLLPKYRGASPVQYAILNGDEMTGITYQLISKRLDAGDILGQIGYKMNQTETSGQLYEVLFNVAADKLPDIIRGYDSGSIKPMPQNEDEATYTYSRTHPHNTFIFKEDGLINWDNGAESVDRKIRAFNPWPIAWTYVKDLENAKCVGPKKVKFREHVKKENTIKIHTAHLDKDKIFLDSIQLEGKKAVEWKEFENGYLE